MNCYKYAAALLSLSFLTFASLPAQAPQTTLVDVGGHKLNVRVSGTARPGAPTVVFESGLGALLGNWNRVQTEVAESTRTVAYERAGIGKSEPRSDAPTVQRIVAELHTLLGKLDVAAPYVLVGHSYGSVITNMFAATYPTEVAGLVHVDPTDFTQTEADVLALAEKAGVKNAREMLARSAEMSSAAAATLPGGMLAEAREVARAQVGGYAEFRAAGDAPDVPLMILLAGRRDPVPAAASAAFPGDLARYREATLEQRIEHFGRLTARASQGTLLVTTKSGHTIHASEPDLVVWGIQRVLSLAKAPRSR
jgi:pimeloyl-ACP methyl ester carboxylesterase